jgi:hypothetical protein
MGILLRWGVTDEGVLPWVCCRGVVLVATKLCVPGAPRVGGDA